MSKRHWRLMILGLLAGSVLFSASKTLRTYWQKKKHLGELELFLQNLRAENENLELRLKRLKEDPRILEQYARRELGLMQPGEMEYRFILHHNENQP